MQRTRGSLTTTRYVNSLTYVLTYIDYIIHRSFTRSPIFRSCIFSTPLCRHSTDEISVRVGVQWRIQRQTGFKLPWDLVATLAKFTKFKIFKNLLKIGVTLRSDEQNCSAPGAAPPNAGFSGVFAP